jgi:hypothetical protein
MRRIIISTDNATSARQLKILASEPDDGLALAVLLGAHKKGGVEILAVLSTFGNRSGLVTYNNCLKQVYLSGLDIPVIKGADYRGQKDSPGVSFLRETLEKSKDKITLLALGPVTDFASVLENSPGLVNKIDDLLFVNSLELPFDKCRYLLSFNSLCDKGSVDFINSLGLLKYHMGGEIKTTYIDNDLILRLKNCNHPMLKFVTENLYRWNLQNKFYPIPGYFARHGNMCPWDLVWSMYLLEPHLFNKTKNKDGSFTLHIKNIEKLKIYFTNRLLSWN